ncbi:hypothetical protein BRD17_01675 [Halobacteriales archaeon SW_7_68_16]|nr:MAG: hypothetical protein BRD17_01675 [Halobacteriales archaeon SW_7_68_16]
MSDDGPGTREIAYRTFATEFDDATLQYAESDEERAPNYVVTPTGARINRLFAVGVLTEVEAVNEETHRGRLADPTGAFVSYAGQYTSDARAFLESADPPAFVATTGKGRTFQPDDSDRVLSSVRPETLSTVDADTRDRWVVATAERTLERVATMAVALDSDLDGPDLRDALAAAGVDDGFADGIVRAIDHYDTGGGYLRDLRETALAAAEVVAGERDEVAPFTTDPDAAGPVDIDTLTRGFDVAIDEDAAGRAIAATTADASAETAAEATDTSTNDGGTGEFDDDGEDGLGGFDGNEDGLGEFDGDDGEDDLGGFDGDDGEDGLGEFDGDMKDDLGEFDGDGGGDPDEIEADADADTDEMFELDESEREQLEEEYGTDFESGTEVSEPGEAGIETPDPPADGSAGEPADAEDDPDAAEDDDDDLDGAAEDDSDNLDGAAEDDDDEQKADDGTDDAGGTDVDAVLLDHMAELDDGDGADREELVAAVAEATGADAATVEEAIQDALMGGRCYDADDGRLKPI